MEIKEKNIVNLLDKDDLKALKDGDHEYLNSVGANCYNDGDYDIARIYYELAAAMGNTTSLSNLGYIYMYGRDVPVDYSLALAYFTMAANKGDIEATYKLGNLYQSGKGVEKNNNLALEYYDKALELIESDKDVIPKDYPSVYFTLAKEMMPGGSKETDLKKAYDYLNIAIDGYNYFIEMEGANHYEKVRDEAYKLRDDNLFKDFK